ncbi:uncharacterized protein LAJ45_09003 [Morchella importuna]|uniref:uncharacterized protein n=1 Tax=Morchella importuna TaxID=1174673 RepID=UPI001E8DD053|nr:uncharacterized protein LAJ45_09003 [Morchella importuna]KAH8146923.1 hypothetical protein LAJ45_09003 [Morchella importuna]
MIVIVEILIVMVDMMSLKMMSLLFLHLYDFVMRMILDRRLYHPPSVLYDDGKTLKGIGTLASKSSLSA